MTVNTLLGIISGIGITKMEAKHDTAYKVMFQKKKTARTGESLNNVTRQTGQNVYHPVKTNPKNLPSISEPLTALTLSCGTPFEAGWETTSSGDSISSKLLKAYVTIFGQFDAARIQQFVPAQVSSFIL